MLLRFGCTPLKDDAAFDIHEAGASGAEPPERRDRAWSRAGIKADADKAGDVAVDVFALPAPTDPLGSPREIREAGHKAQRPTNAQTASWSATIGNRQPAPICALYQRLICLAFRVYS